MAPLIPWRLIRFCVVKALPASFSFLKYGFTLDRTLSASHDEIHSLIVQMHMLRDRATSNKIFNN